MKNLLSKVLLMFLILALPLTFASCGEDEAKDDDTDTAPITYETEDEEGWSPIWRP